MSNSIVIIIPVFRHASKLDSVLSKIVPYGIPLIVIDDGNDLDDRQILLELQKKYSFTLCSHDFNLGKGAALYTGFEKALSLGFTHALQIDADGQHEVLDIPKFVDASTKHPDHIILGAPIFDSDAPVSRVWGRKLTNWLVKFETGSFQLKDALFGFRVYPVSKTIDAYPKNSIRNRMGFDVEVLVKLLWRGARVVTIYTPVYYPKDGISNFKYISDNVQMVFMHISILIRTPFSLIKKCLYYV